MVKSTGAHLTSGSWEEQSCQQENLRVKPSRKMPGNRSAAGPSPTLSTGGCDNSCEVSVSFEDVTVDFRREEWQHLDSAQRFLYQDMTLKTTATSSHWRSFEDVPVDLSREEWPHVDPVQRCLYQDVTLETYSQLCVVGKWDYFPEEQIEAWLKGPETQLTGPNPVSCPVHREPSSQTRGHLQAGARRGPLDVGGGNPTSELLRCVT